MQQTKMAIKDLFWDTRKYILAWVLRHILVVAIIFWMIVIFGFSSQDATESASFSDKIADRIIEYTHPEFDKLSLKEQEEIKNTTSFVVRN